MSDDGASPFRAHLSSTAASLSRTAAFKRGAESRGACGGCLLASQLCICSAAPRLPRAHLSLTVLAHASELRKASSTHVPLARATGAVVRIWRSAACPTAAVAWEGVAAAAAAAGGAAAVLFPSRDALPAAEWLRRVGGGGGGGGGVGGGGDASPSSSPPMPSLAHLALLVLDGTWGNVRAMAAELPPGAQHVVVSPPGSYTLFGPCRAPPAPGRISTLEAVACLLDELRAARRGGGRAVAAAAPATADAFCAAALDPPGSLRIAIRTSERIRVDDDGDADDSDEGGGGGGGGGVAASLRTSADAPAAAAFVQEARRLVVEAGRIGSGGGGGGRGDDDGEDGKKSPAVHAGQDGFPSAAAGIASTVSPGAPPARPGRTVLTAEIVVRAPTVDGEDFWGTALRRYMQVFVDATLANMHKLQPDRTGVGYRTWFLARTPAAAAPAAGGGERELVLLAGPHLSRLPCYLLTQIATFAYGSDAVLPSGYARAFAADVARWGKIISPLPEGALPPPLPPLPPARRAKAAAAVELDAPSGAAVAEWAPSSTALPPPRVRRSAALPQCAAHLRTPLAQTCRALLTLASGRFCGSWPLELMRCATAAITPASRE